MSQSANLKNQGLLVVEDDRELRELLVSILKPVALGVDAVSDGVTACQKIKESVYDILLTDLRLPGLTGEEVVCQARALYPDLIILVVTGYGDVGSAVKGMKL